MSLASYVLISMCSVVVFERTNNRVNKQAKFCEKPDMCTLGHTGYICHVHGHTHKHTLAPTHRRVLTVTEAKVISFDVWADSYDNLHITPTSFLPKKINRKGWRTEGEDVILLLSHKKEEEEEKKHNKANFLSLLCQKYFCLLLYLNKELRLCA